MKINGISATIETPKKKTNKLAVLLPGNLDSKDYLHMKTLASDLNKNGYISVRFNPTGTWDSDGESKDYNISQYLKDTETIINFMINRNKKPFDEIILCGHSLGAQTAIIYASSHNEIDQIVAIEPPGDMAKMEYFQRILPNWEKEGYTISKRNLPDDESKFILFKNPYSFIEDRERYDTIQYAQRLKCKILVLAGESDRIVPELMVKEIYDACNALKEYVVLPGIGHDFRHKKDETDAVSKTVMEYLSK